MREKFLVPLILVFLVFSGASLSADITSEETCEIGEEVLSINSTDGGHAAEPGYYGYAVCVETNDEFEIVEGICEGDRHLFSLFNRTNSHLSMYSSYTYDVCSTESRTRAWVEEAGETCGEGEPVLSVESNNNTHVAEPDSSSPNLCMSSVSPEPENVTLELSGLSGEFYVDGDTIQEGEEKRLFEYPYIVAEEEDRVRGIISYGDEISVSRPEEETASMSIEDGQFILPHTGDLQSIERRQAAVNQREFLNYLTPSFSFHIPDNPLLRVYAVSNHSLEGFDHTIPGDVSLRFRNEGLVGDDLTVSIEED